MRTPFGRMGTRFARMGTPFGRMRLGCRLVGFLVCKRSSSDLVRYEPNCTEMRCDGGLIKYKINN